MPKTKARKNKPLYKVMKKSCIRSDSYAAFCIIKRVRAHLFCLFLDTFFLKNLYIYYGLLYNNHWYVYELMGLMTNKPEEERHGNEERDPRFIYL